MKTFEDIYGFSFGEKPGNINKKWPLGERVRVRTPAKVLEQCGVFCSGQMGRIMDGTMIITVHEADGDVLYQKEDFMNCNVAPAPLDGKEIPDGVPWKIDGKIAQEAPGSMFIGNFWLEPDKEYDFMVNRVEGIKDGEERMMTYRCLRNRGNYPELVPEPVEGPEPTQDDNLVVMINGKRYVPEG